MPNQTTRSMFAEVSAKPGVLQIKFIGPSVGQREVPIISDLVMPELERRLASLKRVVFDLSEINFMNSMGLGLCIDLRNRIVEAGGKAILFGLNQELAELFKMVKVDRLFTVAKDKAELARKLAA